MTYNWNDEKNEILKEQRNISMIGKLIRGAQGQNWENREIRLKNRPNSPPGSEWLSFNGSNWNK
jgi:hypothetical protein